MLRKEFSIAMIGLFILGTPPTFAQGNEVEENAAQFDLSDAEMQTLRERQYINDCIAHREDALNALKAERREEYHAMAGTLAADMVAQNQAPLIRAVADELGLSEADAQTLIRQTTAEQQAEIIEILAGAGLSEADAQNQCMVEAMTQKDVDLTTLGQRWSDIGRNHGFDALDAPVTDPWEYKP